MERAIRIVKVSNTICRKDGIMRYEQWGAQVSRPETGNKPQTASAGRDVIQINYYGTDYAASKADSQLQMDPGKFTQPVVDILNGPALKSPTVEECGYSDRIAQLTAGNSTITTQEAANAVVAYGEWPSYDAGAGEAIDKLSTPGPEVDRFYTLDSVEWNNQTIGFFWRLPGDIADLGMFGQNLMYHFMMRSGFLVHVQCNASKFHQGMLLVAAIPECESTDLENNTGGGNHRFNEQFYLDYPLAQLTLFPHQFINLRTNNSATLVLPYLANFPAECHLIHNMWTIVVARIVPLSYSAGASTIVPITVSIAPMYASFSGLRNLVQRQGGVPVHEVPGSGQFLTTLRQSGYPIYPEFEQTHSWRIPGEVTNLLEVCQIDTFAKLSNVTSDTTGLLVTVQAGRNDQPILTLDMDLNAWWLSTTYLARCAKWFVNWRGSLRLTFTFCGSAMATGKFLVAYTPPGGSAPTSRMDAMLGTHAVWDVGLQSSFSFLVPWIAQTQYRYTGVNQNVFSYAGYVTMWYQTAVVVPPGAESTCQIVCLVSAAEDFVFRMPTDNAYYQGLGDQVGKIMESAVNVAAQKVDKLAVPGNGVPNNPGSIQTGEAAALTAIETGATAATQPTALMETRDVRVTFSARESCIENFFSKYAAMHYSSFTVQSTSTSYITIPLIFADTATTQRSIVAKYRMFTYVRCNYDVVILVNMKARTGAYNGDIRFQAIYCPPGTATPTAQSSAIWDCPTTPSVYGNTANPPVSFRIPFVSPANAYNVFYDGYASFSSTNYGDPPANYLGTLAVRPIDIGAGLVTDVTCRVFARPVNVRAWCPRPIVSLKPTARRLAESRHRMYYVDDGDERETVQEIIYEQFGDSDVEMEPQDEPYDLSRIPNHYLDIAQKCAIFFHEKTKYFHGIPVNHSTVYAPLHLVRAAGSHLMVVNGPQPYLIQEMADRDIAVLKFKQRAWQPVPLHDDQGPAHCWIVNICQYKCGVYAPVGWPVTEITVGASEWGPEHKQYGLTRFDVMTGPGWCGSPVISRKGVVGFVTAGMPGITCVTSFHCVDDLWPMEFQPRPDNFRTAYEVAQVEYHRRKRRGRSFRPYGVCSRVEGFIRNAVADMGRSFGSGVSESVYNTVADLIPEDVDLSSGLVKKVLAWLVKIVCGMVLIAKSEDKPGTAAAVGVMLGIDILTSSPFDWLKEKVQDYCRVARHQIRAHFQGPTEWVKDFNAFCTAFRGLDWLGQKIQEFVDWLKRLFKKESPQRKRFMEQLEQLPNLMESIDKVTQNRGQYRDEDVITLCKNMKALKLGADIYGVERNFCTQQIVRYYQKAEYLMRTCNKARVEPVAICIHGGPGSGKSLATTIIAQKLCQRAGAGMPYSLPPDPKHFDGYCQQHAVIMDDISQNPDGEDMKLFCQMVSSAPFQVPMADLSDKGIAFTSDFVLCSTNADELRPPTIACPEALKRRFFLDLDIEISKPFQHCGNRLNAAMALQCCNGVNECFCFNKCTPMCCGRAVMFKDRNLKATKYSLDQVILLMEKEMKDRRQCGNLLDALFQGPQPRIPRGFRTECEWQEHCKRRLEEVDSDGCWIGQDVRVRDEEAWLESEWDKESCVLKTIDECRKMGVQACPCPKEVADLLQAVPHPSVISFCEKQGWIVPEKVTYSRTRSELAKWLQHLSAGLGILSGLASLAGTIYLIYTLVARTQGPYTGEPKKKVQPPLRRVVKQGPQQDFGTKLFTTSLVNVKTGEGSFSGLGLYGKWILVPKHSEPGDKVIVENQEFKVLDQVEFARKSNSLELVAIKIDRPVSFRDVRKYFVDSHHSEKGCVLLVNTDTYPRYMVPVNEVSPNGILKLEGEMVDNTCRYPYPTRMGQCGGIIITPQNKIIAMHIGGDGWNGYGALIYRKYFDKLDIAEYQGEMKPPQPAPRSINVNRRTVLRPSVFYDVFEGTKEPAALSLRDPRLEVDLEAAMFGKYRGNCDVEELTENMQIAVDHYVSQLRPILPPNVTEPMSLEEVVYGAEGLDGLDLATSAGYPYNTQGIRKKDLIPPRGGDMSRLINALNLNGFDLPFSTYLKDELRPIEKVKAGKTRLIECSSVNDTIRMKMALGRLFATFHQNPGTVTGCAVGCDPDVDWSHFYTEMGDQPLLAFDYSNYDASLSPVWFKCVKLVLSKLGFEVDRLIDHICYSTHIYGGLQYDVEGGMPSGCSGTSIFNSIINNLIIRTVVLDVYKGIDLDSLKIIAYGDDVIASYPFALDAALLAEAGRVYGLTMTPADKSDCFNEVTWETVTFLKRQFRPDDKFPFLIHPVFPLSEVHESIRWCRSASHTQEHVLSLCYLVWHSGEKVYQEFCQKVRSVPIGRALFLPEYSVLYREWLDKF
uniref:Genome polyprotein n=1 Tax=Niviventer confucianus picornavirus TaxID=2184396 RepID=A0A2S1YF67_9VIRU|nr:polyprotein [Niviventer confucianus picornavirus]